MRVFAGVCRAAAGLLSAWLLASPAQAASLSPAAFWCNPSNEPTATQLDRMLRLADAVRVVLAQHGGEHAALVSRSGLDLSRIGQRYSHAGVALAHSPSGRWAVRQLYYTCDEQRPHIYDQGLAGFVMGAEQGSASFVSVLLLPRQAAEPLAQQALQPRVANALVGEQYSANAHVQSLRYQNCNQWVAELLAYAWSNPMATPDDGARQAAPDGAPPWQLRAQAQQAMQAQGYTASVIEPSPLVRLSALFIPWLHDRDHPADEVAAGRYHVSMPASLETWASQRWPTAQRVELCVTERQLVVRRGGAPLPDDCTASAGDAVTPLAAAGPVAPATR